MVDCCYLNCCSATEIGYSIRMERTIAKKQLQGHFNALWLHWVPKSVAIISFITLSISIYLFARLVATLFFLCFAVSVHLISSYFPLSTSTKIEMDFTNNKIILRTISFPCARKIGDGIAKEREIKSSGGRSEWSEYTHTESTNHIVIHEIEFMSKSI